MTPYFHDDWLTIYQGDVRDMLPTLPADSVDCIVTSPPYWGLRDYGTAAWSGGDEACDHRPNVTGRALRPSNGLTGGKATVDAGTVKGGDCGKCGATRSDGQIGLERTPEEYVANLVGVFRELRRVLKPAGTAWCNLGDSFLPGKQLVGIPWRVAFALQADGWYLRSDIIWSKPNPMPESVTDRPTKAHEYLFLLTKSARYYFDADAVREPNLGPVRAREKGNGESVVDTKMRGYGSHAGTYESGRNLRSVWTIATRPYPGAHFAVFPPELPERCIKAGSSERGVCPECGAPWERVVERVGGPPSGDHRKREGFGGTMKQAHASGTVDGSALSNIYREYGYAENRTTGWSTTCAHTSSTSVPAVVLDPFAGSGTTGMVANRLSRRAILVDLNGDYLKQQLQRNAQTPLGLGAA